MVRAIDGLLSLADSVDAIVFDQWGVLHDGTRAYLGAAEAIIALAGLGKELAVLSNSGKRAAPNRARIAGLGLPTKHISSVMTSGEAFWQDLRAGRVCPGRLLPITAKPGDFALWSEGAQIEEAATLEDAQAVLLMGLPEGSDGSKETALLEETLARKLPLICTNPDRASPRADGAVQLSPGALAHAYRERGGDVTFYGKPHRPIFDSLLGALGTQPSRTLMVGDSLEHDIAGASNAGWKSVLVMGGLHADAFQASEPMAATRALAKAHNSPLPDYLVGQLA